MFSIGASRAFPPWLDREITVQPILMVRHAKAIRSTHATERDMSIEVRCPVPFAKLSKLHCELLAIGRLEALGFRGED